MTIRLDQDDANRRAAALIAASKKSMGEPGHDEGVAALTARREEADFETRQITRRADFEKREAAASRRHLRIALGVVRGVLLIVIGVTTYVAPPATALFPLDRAWVGRIPQYPETTRPAVYRQRVA